MQSSTEAQYKMIESVLSTANGDCTTYGIAGKHVRFEDVSTDPKKVADMVDRLNHEQLEESQFMYFISDEIDK